MLTTITPYWGRPEMLPGWLKSIRGASILEVSHIIFFIGETVPEWWRQETAGLPIVTMAISEKPKSIGHYHNMGARMAITPWIMKLDVDTIPNVNYFDNLIPVLQRAGARDWFNGGMIYLSRSTTDLLNTPVDEKCFNRIMSDPRRYTINQGHYPKATNFICRKGFYLKWGGCDPEFRNYGWEDYQQIYMLEYHRLGTDPLPGPVNIGNVTQRCRDEIGEPKAKQLYDLSRWLVLFHRWHPQSPVPEYRTAAGMDHNRRVLLNYVTNARSGIIGNARLSHV